jgi:hypothetical protein
MNTTQWVLNLGILVLMLSQLGTHQATARRILVPLGVVTLVAFNFLPGTPTAGNDVAFETIGAVVGAVLGVVAASLMRLRTGSNGQVTVTAGAAYAALWTAIIGGRMAFALWATGAGAQQVGHFSMANHITGPAWTSFFVLMALAMIATRTVVLGTRVAARRAHRTAQYA